MKNITLSKKDREVLIDPLYRFERSFWLRVIVLTLLFLPGLLLYIRQLVLGLGVTDLNRPAFWGIYLVNFIFLIGISMAGTVISAVLHLLHIEWRRPITRIAEALTVFGLMVAGLQIIIDMGRPDRLLYTLYYGRFQAPLIWDIISLSLYLLTAIFALYLQLLPDIALLRDTVPATAPAWRKKLYQTLALNWRGNPKQWHLLEKTMKKVSIIIVPIGISLHTVTSWLFSTSTQPGWKSTILGPYFVIGAIFSGIGLLFGAVAFARRSWNLYDYINETFFEKLGWIFIVMSATWFYFTLNEVLVLVTEQESMEFPVMAAKLFGEFAPAFWGMVLLMVTATWMMLAPKMLSARLPERIPALQPRFAWGYALTALIVAAFPTLSARIPAFRQMAYAPSSIELFSKVLFLILLLMLGLSTISWLKAHPVQTTVVAGLLVVIGMWLERWNIIMPTMTHARLIPYDTYTPTLTEIAITLSLFALLGLFFVVFFKFFPPVSIWEVRAGQEKEEIPPQGKGEFIGKAIGD